MREAAKKEFHHVKHESEFKMALPRLLLVFIHVHRAPRDKKEDTGLSCRVVTVPETSNR